MCTFILAWQAFADASVVVAATRDERYDRPSQPPARRGGDPAVVAPRDERAGGTWIGYNEAGLLAAVTNRWTVADREGERSRGLLVTDALAARSVGEAAAVVEDAVAGAEYAGFNLVLADGDRAALLTHDGDLSVADLDPGVHVVVNVGAADEYGVPDELGERATRQAASARRARAALAVADGESVGGWLDRATAVLSDHDYGFCVHGDEFGTRSASVITLRADGAASYRFAPGPPCRTALEDVAATAVPDG